MYVVLLFFVIRYTRTCIILYCRWIVILPHLKYAAAGFEQRENDIQIMRVYNVRIYYKLLLFLLRSVTTHVFDTTYFVFYSVFAVFFFLHTIIMRFRYSQARRRR